MGWRCPAYHTTNLLIKELFPTFWLMLMLRTDFKSLQNEVSREIEAVAELPRDIRDALFHTILAKLKDQGALQDLTDMVRRGSHSP